MKRFVVTVAIDVAVDLPEEHPGDGAHVVKMLAWKQNDYRDGRYPFSREMMTEGLMYMVGQAIEESAFQIHAEPDRGNPKIDWSSRHAARDAAMKGVDVNLDDDEIVFRVLKEDGLYLIDNGQLQALSQASKRLHTEDRMNGDEMRDLAHLLAAVVKACRAIPIPNEEPEA